MNNLVKKAYYALLTVEVIHSLWGFLLLSSLILSVTIILMNHPLSPYCIVIFLFTHLPYATNRNASGRRKISKRLSVFAWLKSNLQLSSVLIWVFIFAVYFRCIASSSFSSLGSVLAFTKQSEGIPHLPFLFLQYLNRA